MILRPATFADAGRLTEVAIRSKAHWGYSPEFMAACRSELVITPEDCASGLVVLAENHGTSMGFYQLAGSPPTGELSDLFVEPEAIGQGIGKQLWQAALEQASRLDFTALTIHADPHAEAFYLHLGAKRIGSAPSHSIPGRELPLLKIELKN